MAPKLQKLSSRFLPKHLFCTWLPRPIFILLLCPCLAIHIWLKRGGSLQSSPKLGLEEEPVPMVNQGTSESGESLERLKEKLRRRLVTFLFLVFLFCFQFFSKLRTKMCLVIYLCLCLLKTFSNFLKIFKTQTR